MASFRSFDDVLSSVPDAVRWKLDQEIADSEHRDARGQVIPQHLGRIAESMIDWEGVVADYLGLSEADRSNIREKNHNKPSLQRREALGTWKSRLGSEATYRALIEVFFKAGRLDYADTVCGLFKDVISTRGAHKSMSNECSKFIADMKRKYGERHINSEKQWPPCHSDKLVRLALVEREKGEGYSANSKGTKRTPLAYGDLFKVESGKRPVRKVLVEGDAGIGKTTLCIAVSEDWANGKLFQQFKLVLLLPLRMKAVASAGTLPELLKLLDPGSGQMLCDSVARYFEGIEKGSNMLIIADGWDELSESERQEGSFLYQLIFHSMISVIVTSRPSASAPLHELPDIDQFVEVRGFSKEHIIEYIQSEFASDQEKAGRLLEQLEDNPLVESVCSVPLNCTIVCHLWRTLEEALPATMTELYTKIILNLVLQNVRKINTYKSVLSLPKFESLPSDLQQSWWLLCEFAFQALEKDQLVFSQEELEVFFPEGLALDKRILCFGLLQMADSAGLGISFHFLHLTFQEYLAALHLARQTPDKQLKIFHKHKANNRLCFEMVWKFFFGINDFNMASSYIQQYFECVAEEDDDFVSLSVCHCAFEARNDLINDEIAQFLSNHYSQLAFDSPHTTHDCSAVLYVIANIQECCDGYDVMIALNYARENQIKEVMHIIADKKGKILVTALLLRECRLTASGLLALESAVRDDLLAELEVLDLAGSLTSDAETNVEWLTTFVEAVSAHCPDLETLDLSCNRLANGVSVQIVDFDYLTKLKTLNKLTIPGHGALINDGTDINANFMETILATNSPYVKRLNLSYNNLGLPGVSAVSKTFDDRHSILILLHLHKTYLGDKGITILIKNHKVLSGLESVDNDNIRTTSVLCTADAGCPGKLELVMDFHNTNFSTLDLCHNPLGLEGTRAVGRILSSTCSQLLDAILCRCELTAGGGPPNADSLNLDNTISCETVGQQLCQMPQSSTITKLELDCNSFTGEGIHILAGFMHLCPCLNHLYTSDCSITSDDLIWLLDKLTQLKCSSPSSLCSELDYWYLYNNQIDDRGASALIDHLSSLFPRMVNKDDIILTNNLVSIEMLKRLEEELRNHKEIIKRQEEEEEQRNLESTPEPIIKGQCKEQEKSKSSLPVPLTRSSDQSALLTLPQESGLGQCGFERVAGIFTLFSSSPSSLPSSTLTLSDEEGSSSDIESDTSLDLRPPPSKRHKQDLDCIEHRFLDLIKWEDEKGIKRELRTYSKIGHKWRQIATQLGFELGQIDADYRTRYSCITAVFRQWFAENAKNLPNASRYPKSWQGLINLLEDAELGEVVQELNNALTSTKNSVRGNLP